MDNFIVSARKYRPATFHQVVGQQTITSTLQNAIKNNHLAQAFLFTGPRGVGKTTCARILAKTINCENLTEDLEPCNQCESCTSFNNNASFNIHELDAASNNSVDDIRHLVEQVRIPPQIGRYKVYIIDEVHMLSQAAFNAFLKTLEEPPAYAKFILATTEKHKIIPTILSRCQIFDFKRITVDDMANYLGYIAESENVDAEIEARHIIAQKADGAMRDALSTFDQIVSYSGNKVTYQDVIENLNILDYEYYFKVTSYLVNNDIASLLLIFNEIIENGFDGQHFIVGLAEHLRSLLVLQSPATIQLMHASGSLKEKYVSQANACSTNFLLDALQICNKFDLNYKASSNKKLHIEIALLDLSRLTSDNTSPALHSFDNKKPVSAAKVMEKKTEYKPYQPQVTKPIVVEKQEPVIKTEPKNTPPTTDKIKTTEKVDDTTNDDKNTIKKPSPNKVGNGKVIRNISIKQTLKDLRKKDEADDETQEKAITTEFSQDKLVKTWNSFIASYLDKSPSFANAIAKYKPILKENFEIEYKVDSLIITKDIHSVTSLLEYLKTTLNNNQITLKPIVTAKDGQKTAYTDREKFSEMTKKYPNIVKLKDQLNLEIEF